MKLEDLAPDVDERLFIGGKSGTGKTHLTKRIAEWLAGREPVIVIDTKPDPKWDHPKWWHFWKRKGGIQALPHFNLKRLKPGIYVYRPKVYPEWSDPGVQKILLNSLKVKPSPKEGERVLTLIIDELTDLSRGPLAIPPLAKAIRQGRAKHVRMIIGTQRPAGVPLIAITEANKVIALKLRSSDDRKRLEQWVADEMIKTPGPGKHDFWVKTDDEERAVLIHQ